MLCNQARSRADVVGAAAGFAPGRKRWTSCTGENEALRERLSRLSEASLRINESLDFDTVLQGVLDSARSLTGARYGVMTLMDDEGTLEDFLSSGLTAAESELLWLMRDGLGVLQALTDVTEPVRIPDLAEHVRALGFTEFTIPVSVDVFRFMAAPMFPPGRPRGTRLRGRQGGQGGVQPGR